MATSPEERTVSSATVKRRMIAGMTYEEALSIPPASQAGPQRRFVPRAKSLAVIRLNEVRRALSDVRKVLARRPRDVKANARLDRIEGELKFLESLFESQ
jgi:hypothetical protein